MIETIIKKIAGSKKYHALYLPTIERVVRECADKHGIDQAETHARKLLHQIWGAYWTTRPRFSKLLKKLDQAIQSGLTPKEAVQPILAIHSSTQERIDYLDEFYDKIFAITGAPESIVDYACGLNPLAFWWMNLSLETKYWAHDIDLEEIEFLEKAFEILGLTDQVICQVGDVLDHHDYNQDDFDTSNCADVVFMFKLLPLLEHQRKGASLEVMQAQKCQSIVISFPVKSLSGQDKGMDRYYQNWFQNLIQKENWETQMLEFPNELVFVVQK